MRNSRIETKIKYFKEIEIVFDRERIQGSPYIRIDYHKDGSSSYYYGIEMDEDQFRLFGIDQWKLITQPPISE